MKKLFSVGLVLLLSFSLCACNMYTQDDVDRITESEYQRGYDAGKQAVLDDLDDIDSKSEKLFDAIAELEEYTKILGETSETRYEQWLKQHPENEGIETNLSTIWSDIYSAAAEYTQSVDLLK